MVNFIILNRIGKNDNEYLLWILDLNDNMTKFVIYDRNLKKVVPKKPYGTGFVDYTTGLEFEHEIDLESFETDFDEYSIHRFDYDSNPNIESIHYSVKRKETKEIFVPCSGKHPKHEDLLRFSKYTSNWQVFEEIYIEGYIITDIPAFDKYITGLNPSEIVVDFVENDEKSTPIIE